MTPGFSLCGPSSGARIVLTCLAGFILVPATAHATDIARASTYETPARKGFYAEIAVRPGATVLRDGLMPMVRHHLTIGAGLSDRFKLGTSFHVGAYLGAIKKPVLGVDVIATGYLWRGLYVRAGFGVVNRLPLLRGSDATAPGYGGLAGFGYEWKMAKAAGIGLGADFDARMIHPREVRHSFFVGLHFHFH